LSKGDSLTYHLGQQFSTRDRDNDSHKRKKCAQLYAGAWWYKDCLQSNLNGVYSKGKKGKRAKRGMEWITFRGEYYSNKFSEMKMRPFNVH